MESKNTAKMQPGNRFRGPIRNLPPTWGHDLHLSHLFDAGLVKRWLAGDVTGDKLWSGTGMAKILIGERRGKGWY